MTEENKPQKSKYSTNIVDLEHNAVMKALLVFKGTEEYLNNKEIQKTIRGIEKKIKETVEVVKNKEKYKSNPKKYSELTYEQFLEQTKNGAPEEPKHVSLTKEEYAFLGAMTDNCLIGTMLLGIRQDKMIDILNVVAQNYKKAMDEKDNTE